MSANQINANEMSAAHRNFLAADMCIFFHDLEKLWAPEIKMDPRLLREYLFKAAMDGLFDNILLQTGNTENGLHIVYVDSDLYVHVLSKYLHRLWGDRGLRRKLAKENFNGNPLDFYELTARCLWGLRKEAVWIFCRARNVTPPSFWPFPKQPSPERRPHAKEEEVTTREESEIKKFLLAIEPRSMQVHLMEKMVVDKFNVNRNIARKLVGGLPSGQKMPRGRRPQKSAM